MIAHTRRTAVGLLGLALLALAVAPLWLPAGYSVITHSVSESAAQGLGAGWLARSGLLIFGVAVLLLVIAAPTYWDRWARTAHLLFGVAMIATAAFSHAPWDGSPGDVKEDTIHSVASFAVGFSFIVGVALVVKPRDRPGRQPP